MTYLFGLIAIFIAWIWVDYFRMIGGFSRKHLWMAVLLFVGGALSTFLVDVVDHFAWEPLTFQVNGVWWNDLAYSIVGIGMVEELCKVIPVVLLIPLLKSRLKDPLSWLAIFCTSALGFSAFENWLYFSAYGGKLVDGRAVLATVGHMCDTALVAYGWILFRFKHQGKKFHLIPVFFVLGAISHGVYDFWLIWDGVQGLGIYITVLYFFFTISLFATILNNSYNHSIHFSYKESFNPFWIIGRLVIYYSIVFVLKWIIFLFIEDGGYTLGGIKGDMIFTIFILFITILRLGRFQPIQGYWRKLRFELPFSFPMGPDKFFGISYWIKVKGYAFNDVPVDCHLGEYFRMVPLNPSYSVIQKARWAYLEEKFFLEGQYPVYSVRVYQDQQDGQFVRYYLKRKYTGDMFVEELPVLALMKQKPDFPPDPALVDIGNYQMMEWIAIRPKDERGN